jgi:hypothetical protein
MASCTGATSCRVRKEIALLAKFLVDWTVSEHISSEVIRREGDANDDFDDDLSWKSIE